MKKAFFITLTLILLFLIAGNIAVLRYFCKNTSGNRIVRLDHYPDWMRTVIPNHPDMKDYMVYKISTPDSAIFFKKDNPQDFMFAQNGKHILCVNNVKHEYSILYHDLQNPQYFVDWVELKNGPRVLEVTWRKTTYYDFNGDMIFDLQMAPKIQDPCMYSSGGKWKSCKILSLKNKIIQDGNSIYVFKNGQWQKSAEKESK